MIEDKKGGVEGGVVAIPEAGCYVVDGGGKGVMLAPPLEPPLETFVVRIPELGCAEICITPCPGKRQRDVGLDLDQLKKSGCVAVVTLIQPAGKALN